MKYKQKNMTSFSSSKANGGTANMQRMFWMVLSWGLLPSLLGLGVSFAGEKGRNGQAPQQTTAPAVAANACLKALEHPTEGKRPRLPGEVALRALWPQIQARFLERQLKCRLVGLSAAENKEGHFGGVITIQEALAKDREQSPNGRSSFRDRLSTAVEVLKELEEFLEEEGASMRSRWFSGDVSGLAQRVYGYRGALPNIEVAPLPSACRSGQGSGVPSGGPVRPGPRYAQVREIFVDLGDDFYGWRWDGATETFVFYYEPKSP